MPIISLPLIHFKLQLVLQFIFSQPSGSDSGLGDHPLPRTQAFLKDFVIRLASCMQINQPTMKVTEQSTKITLKPSANSHFQGRETPELSHGGARTPRPPCACSTGLHQSIHAESRAQGSASYIRKTRPGTGTICVRGAKYSKL